MKDCMIFMAGFDTSCLYLVGHLEFLKNTVFQNPVNNIYVP